MYKSSTFLIGSFNELSIGNKSITGRTYQRKYAFKMCLHYIEKESAYKNVTWGGQNSFLERKLSELIYFSKIKALSKLKCIGVIARDTHL